MFKSYSSKSAALKGAKRANLTAEALYEQDGKWGFDTDTKMEEVAPEAPQGWDVAETSTEETPKVEDAPAAPVTEGTTGRKIEKDREERNGIKRPSVGGMCRAVWDYCDSIHTDTYVPTAKDVKEAAGEFGWNPNNASIEYYQWRKFNGIRGRLAKPAAPTEA